LHWRKKAKLYGVLAQTPAAHQTPAATYPVMVHQNYLTKPPKREKISLPSKAAINSDDLNGTSLPSAVVRGFST
jgi:hypothetical protein